MMWRRGLIEISDKIARLSEAEYAFEAKRRKLEHQFEVTNSELREEYLAAVRGGAGNPRFSGGKNDESNALID
jgi:hypothetical protein